MFELTDRDFDYIANSVKDYCGINLTGRKKPLVRTRLLRRVRELQLDSIADYIQILERENSADEFRMMVDLITTNYTHFFREQHHFDYLSKVILPRCSSKNFRIWSAASSAGHEIYSIAITIEEYLLKTKRRLNYNLYASDISDKVLLSASRGVYQLEEVEKINRELLTRYFLRGVDQNAGGVKVKKTITEAVSFFRLNLQDKQYHLPLMDVIFLRNVLIYFDLPTKIELIARLQSQLKDGGYLILGHSESLNGISDDFQMVGKTLYIKKEGQQAK